MKETAMDVNERKIRNGIRKQRQKIEREQQKVWDRLKDTSPKPRYLEASWTVEAADDLQSYHGIDLEQEITDILTAEINAGRWDE